MTSLLAGMGRLRADTEALLREAEFCLAKEGPGPMGGLSRLVHELRVIQSMTSLSEESYRITTPERRPGGRDGNR